MSAQVGHRRMDDKIGKLRFRLWVTPLADRQRRRRILQRHRGVGPVTVRAEGCGWVLKIDAHFAVDIIKVCGGLILVAAAANGDHAFADLDP